LFWMVDRRKLPIMESETHSLGCPAWRPGTIQITQFRLQGCE